MTKQIEGVSEKILACAKEEFLEKGYSEASLRTIAAKAGYYHRIHLFPVPG